MQLDSLFKDEENKECNGCSILKLPGEHCIKDWEDKEQVDILFVSDSLKMYQGDLVAFRANEYKALREELNLLPLDNIKVGYTASVKCPNLKYDDISAPNRKICRKYLERTIEQYKPKLVFACGKLPTTMFYGKNKEDKKTRGKIAEMEISGVKFKLVSIFHPYQAIAEPKNRYLFSLDIRLAIEEVILGIVKKSDFTYVQIHSIDDLNREGIEFLDTGQPVSIDIETTGLDFSLDVIHSCALSVLDSSTGLPAKTISIPIDHRDTKSYGADFREAVITFLIKVMGNRKNRKILQKAKFDLKFLYREGVKEVYNVWDCKIIQHFYNEDVPKDLAALVNYYYPNEI